jgi:two-component system LytT family response regulator
MKNGQARWRVVIADDEPPARRTLALLLAREPDFELVAECTHGSDTVAAVARERPDVLFLDVRMPGLDGFDVLRELGPEAPAVVFVTAYDHYAPQAFERHAVEYLLKPFTDERFADVVEHLRVRLREQRYASLAARLPEVLERVAEKAAARQLVIRDGGRTHVIKDDEIVWLEADDYCVKIHARGRHLLVRDSLRTLARRLDPAVFARVHRSAIVNTRCITSIEPLASGDQKLLLADGTTLRVSRTRRAALMRLLNS